MNSLPSLLLFLLNLFLQVQSQVCPRYWTALGSQCYRAFAYTEPTTENRTWSAARERCTNSGGYLVSVNDVQEDAIVNHVRRVAGIQDDCYYWIGLNDKDTEGRFMWLDGTAPTYFNWLLGEPQSNNPTSALAATEDFVLASGSKHWSDVRDDWTAVINNNLEPTGYVCEQDARPPPGPSGDPGPPGPPGIVGPPGNRGEEGPPGSTGDPGPPGEPGETGDQGPPGDQGSQGETGDPGALGQPGSPGPPGAVGDTGQQGIRGEPGVPGSVGPLGDQGLSGSEGPRGKPGPPGEPGDLGQPGETGDKGPDGDPGPPGIQGPDGGPGPIGEQGQQGIQGTPGVQGHPGDAGPPGPIGLRGDSGETGPIGPVGPQGPIGDKGEEGDQGIPGLRGDEGIPGTRGPQGRPGNSGAQGDKGAQGDEGPPGTAGPSGDKGAEGDQGEKGDTGDQGIVGPEGPPGTAGPSGDKGVKGDKGDPGDDGPDGTSGPRGVIGLPGPPGPPGPEVEFTGLPNNSVALPGGSIPYFINVTAYCINSGAGIFPHPLHCWQFVTCGPILGDMEVSCYTGRRFNTASGTCVTDPTCVFGAPNFGPISGTSPLISGAPPYVAEVERLKQTMRVYSGVVVGLLVSVGLLFPAVGWLYLTRKPVIVPNPNRNHRRLKEVECGSVLTNQV